VAPRSRWCIRNQTLRLNRAIWKEHHSRYRAPVRAVFDSGYGRVARLVEALSPERLRESGHYEWTGKHPLSTSIGPNTASL
jgi:hypothetical protein